MIIRRQSNKRKARNNSIYFKMIYFTREEKRVFLCVSLILFIGVCFRYVARVNPWVETWTQAIETDRFYPKLDINRATQQELITIPQIGPVIAQRIVEFRSGQGPFQDLKQLRNVPGIGPAKYQTIIKYLKPLP